MVERVDEAALKQGFEELHKLSEEEYRQPLAEVASDADATQSAVRVGRLVGVILKQPFAESVKLPRAFAPDGRVSGMGSAR